ncbi:alpha/beta fold hydrolase [Phenylobacterium deserti]|uniref:Alpha/beta hydrolase n=1 Tax=Phenylobacterium deserti TaxID=1914756 RepID=A0A328ARN9_9CAUL|nr:alpha/beta fold hydrolase [Phenylobacterium deserti]RAK56975.1 alpha/beta hydrolase [Phenylobacterium deserti]
MSQYQCAAHRGDAIDVGGRKLRVVISGPRSERPTILLEHGAFGCAADWAEVQSRLAAKGLRSIAYDRAGLGHSDPGPSPRDGRAIVADASALLQTLGEREPVVLVGHSMGGLMVRLFALTHPEQALGLVLVDAVTPDITRSSAGLGAVRAYGRAMRWVSKGARFGMMRPVALLTGNLIGLTGDAALEKRRIYGSHGHACAAADEVSLWPETALMAGEAELPMDLPVAVVTAGAEKSAAWLKAIQAVPALASRNGYVEHVAGAHHASLLGRRFADPVVRGVEHVLSVRGR